MNNEIKYVLRGCLLAMLAIITFTILKFFASYSSSTAESSSVVYYDYTNQSNKSVRDSLAENISGSQGSKLFAANCASCHRVNKRLVGPALANVEERGPWSDRKQVYKWIHNPEKYMKSDAYTTGLFREYNGIMMQAFPSLSENDIDAILDYIRVTPVPSFVQTAVP